MSLTPQEIAHRLRELACTVETASHAGAELTRGLITLANQIDAEPKRYTTEEVSKLIYLHTLSVLWGSDQNLRRAAEQFDTDPQDRAGWIARVEELYRYTLPF